MNRTLTQAVLAAVKRAEHDREPAKTRIPRRGRPTFTLTVDKTGEHPDPGTLVLDDTGTRGRLYVGRLRRGIPVRDRQLVDRLRQLQHVEIVSTGVTAGKEARVYLNRRWRLEDIADSGLLSESASALLRKR